MRAIVGLTQTRSLPFLINISMIPIKEDASIKNNSNHVRRRDASSTIYREDILRSLSIQRNPRDKERDRERFDLPHRSVERVNGGREEDIRWNGGT